jgi:hypothetical protein
MRHYVPLQTKDGWAVCYFNHRREFVSVMECATLETAYIESVNLTIQALEEAARILEAAPKAKSVYHGGNRYLRGH